jgi:type IV pilus assembly protein PilF
MVAGIGRGMVINKDILLIAFIGLLLSACTTTGVKQGDSSTDAQDKASITQVERDLEEGKTDLALLELEPLLKSNPNSAHLHGLAGQAYARNDDIPNAEKHYSRAIELSPDDTELLMNYGVLLCQQEKYVDADNAFLRAIRDTDNFYRDIALVNAGICAKKAGELQRAERYFNAALQVNPDSAIALYQLARLSMAVGNPAQARTFIIRYDAIAKPTPKSLLLSVLIGDELGDYNLASQSSDQLMELFPNSPEAGSLAAGVADRYMGLPENESPATTTVAPGVTPAVLSSMLASEEPAEATASQAQPAVSEERVLSRPETTMTPEQGSGDELPGILWIESQPEAHYTLQLSASSNVDNLLELRERLNLEQFAVFRFVRDGKVIYALVSGSYADYQQAIQAGDALSQVGYQEQPWVRKFSIIQKMIRTAQ